MLTYEQAKKKAMTFIDLENDKCVLGENDSLIMVEGETMSFDFGWIFFMIVKSM